MTTPKLTKYIKSKLQWAAQFSRSDTIAIYEGRSARFIWDIPNNNIYCWLYLVGPNPKIDLGPMYDETGQGLIFFVLILALLACALILLSIVINPDCIDAIAAFWALIQNLIRSI